MKGSKAVILLINAGALDLTRGKNTDSLQELRMEGRQYIRVRNSLILMMNRTSLVSSLQSLISSLQSLVSSLQ
jgi:hypothetical protein